MSYFIITHPRSGSSNLVVSLSKKLSEDRPTWNLDEFFHPGAMQLWGDYRKIKNFIDQGIVLELEQKEKYFNNFDLSDSKNLKNVFFKEKSISRNQLSSWKTEEIIRRLKFIDDLNSKDQEHILKIFVDSDLWLNFNFPQDKSIVLYRKNFLDSILSILIKDFYRDNIIKDHKNFTDNYKGNRIEVPDFSFEISYEIFLQKTRYFFDFLKFCQKNKNIEKICYEDLYLNRERKKIFDKDIDVDFLNRSEKKLNYYKNKESYIENIEELKKWIYQIIDNKNLIEICEDLSIKI